MRNAKSISQWLLGLAALTIFTFILVALFSRVGAPSQSPAAAAPSVTVCAPTPARATEPPGPATPTPDRAHFGTVPPPQPTMTPYPISKITDMSPDVPDNYKGRELVFHCDGTYELFLNANYATAVPLRPGDVIIYAGAAPAMEGARPPTVTAFAALPATIMPTPTTPITTPMPSATGQPYPGPSSSVVTPANTCVPTTIPPTIPSGPPTATPDRALGTTIPYVWPTPTPYPISKTTDLSPNVSVSDKGKVLVFHCDGTYELFLTVDPANGVVLQPGDLVIYRALSPSALELQAPTAGPRPTSTALPEDTPVMTSILPTGQPYPGPTTGTAAPTN